MKKALLILFFACALAYADWPGFGPYIPFIQKVDLDKVDWKTNKVESLIWNRLQTNTSDVQRPVFAIHAVYPACTCPSCTGQIWEERTEVFLVLTAEVEGKRVDLESKMIWATNRAYMKDVKRFINP